LDSINSILQRSRELAIQAANGTLSDADRASVNAEYQQLAEEIDRLAFSTEAFGKTPLAPAEPRPLPVKLARISHRV
jgi:flagellin